MAGHAGRGGFLSGMACGVVAGCAVLALPVLWLGTRDTLVMYGGLAPHLHLWWDSVRLNLQGAVVPFAAIGLCYWLQLHRLDRLLAEPEPALDRALRHEQMLDLCANLFFGVGVIWTAIGMRHALLHALGDPAGTAEAGAFAVLQRLVDGGILLALSTTIVGGIGGYVMRTVKSLVLGRSLNALYMRSAEQPGRDSLATLQRIERSLRRQTPEGDQT